MNNLKLSETTLKKVDVKKNYVDEDLLITALDTIQNDINSKAKKITKTSYKPVAGTSITPIEANPDKYGRAIALGKDSNDNEVIVVVYTDGWTFTSKDGGKSFIKRAELGDYARDLVFKNGYFYAVKKENFYKISITDLLNGTSDNLATWTKLDDIPSKDGRRMFITSDGTFYIFGDSKIYTVSDNDKLTEYTALTENSDWQKTKTGMMAEISDGTLFSYSVYNQENITSTAIFKLVDEENGTWERIYNNENLKNALAGIVEFKGKIIGIISENQFRNPDLVYNPETGKFENIDAEFSRSVYGYAQQVIVSRDKDVLMISVNNPIESSIIVTKDLKDWHYLTIENDQYVRSWYIVQTQNNGLIGCGSDNSTFLKLFNQTYEIKSVTDLEDIDPSVEGTTILTIVDKLNLVMNFIKDMNS